MNDGLKDRHRQAILDVLRAHPGVDRAVLFGSRAMGTFTPASDVDICLYGDSLTLTDQARLTARMEELTIPQRVDLLPHHAIEDQALLDHIAREGKVLFERDRGKGGEGGKTRLGDVTDIIMGQSPPGETCNTEGAGLPLLNGPTDYGPHHPSAVQWTTAARKRARSGDVLFCVRGSTTGRMNWADREYAIGRGVAAIRHKESPELQPLVHAVVEYGLPGLLLQATGSTFPNVSANQLAGLWWPSLPERQQRAIAHILGTLDDKIELNRRMNETLEAMAQALFKSWFVDFDPVRAKAEGRDSGLPKILADLFPARFVDSELGEIPEGWEVGTLGNVAEHPRRSVQPDDIEPSVPYIALGHMPKRCIALSDWGVAEGLESNKFEFKKHEILFGKLRPYFHKVGVAPVDGVCSTDIVVMAPQAPHWLSFVLGLVSSDEFVDYTNAGSTGTKMPRTSWSDMARYEVALPPITVAESFGKWLHPAIERIIAGIHESRSLVASRDTLLPRLISGELRVKDAGESQAIH